MLMIFDSSSSSDTSSEDEEIFEIILENNNNKHERPRLENHVENIVHMYNNEDFKENFRLSRTTFEYLLYLLRPELDGPIAGFGRNPISPEKQLLIALYVLGTPDSYRSIISKFGTSLSVAWRATKRVVKALYGYRNYFIQWPTENEMRETAHRIQTRTKFPGVFGAVDGTLIQITAPKVDRQSYVDRKGRYSIQLQVVCNDKLEFIHCFTGLPGSVHDMRVFRYSGLQQKLNLGNCPRNSHILGDAAYNVQNHVMVPYINNGHLTVEELYFNKTLSKTRLMVERSIGQLKLRWRYLLEKLPMRNTKLIPYYIISCCILHNICLKLEDNFEYPVVIPNTIDVNANPMLIDNNNEYQGLTKRQLITEFLSLE